MIDTLEYNSTRKSLMIPEYGRNIQKMVEYCITISDREERTKMAHQVVEIMALIHNINIQNNAETLHKLWDHIFIISNFKLDVDSPFPRPEEKSLVFEPSKPAYNNGKTDGDFRNYGKNIKQLIQETSTIEDEEERNKMALLLANHMKKACLAWNHDIVPDEVVLDHLYRFSRGRLALPPDTVLMSTNDIYAMNAKTESAPKPTVHTHSNGFGGKKKKKKIVKK
ncbi:MAG: DUF4290 domain-containing protein [Bacteroidales bacterium]|nr:DUF4290 domain-containing protein [Bacteroidales bacterium]